MELKTFFNTFKEAVAQDSNLAAWASAQFGRQLSVWADLPADTFPDVESDYPFVVIMPVEKDSDQQRRLISYRLEAWLAFSMADYKKTTARAGLTEATGSDLICDFIEYVKAAVVAALPANTTVGFVELVDALGHPPDVEGFIEMSFRHEPTIGYGDPTIT